MRRWLRWVLVCRRGSRCADLHFTELGENAPAGAMAVAEYICGGCGTKYKITALIGNDRSFTESERLRV